MRLLWRGRVGVVAFDAGFERLYKVLTLGEIAVVLAKALFQLRVVRAARAELRNLQFSRAKRYFPVKMASEAEQTAPSANKRVGSVRAQGATALQGALRCVASQLRPPQRRRLIGQAGRGKAHRGVFNFFALDLRRGFDLCATFPSPEEWDGASLSPNAKRWYIVYVFPFTISAS